MIRVFGESLSAPSTASRVAGNRPPFLPLPASPENVTVNQPVAQGYWHAALCSVPTARVDLFEDRTRSGEGQARRSRRAPSSPRTPVAIPGRGEQADAERDHHDAGDRPPSTAGHERAADQSPALAGKIAGDSTASRSSRRPER